MEIVDLTHGDISIRKRPQPKPFIKFHNRKEIYFSKDAVKSLGLNEGVRVHFVNDDQMWHFYLDNLEGGFPLHRYKNRAVLSIFNQSLINLIQKRANISIPSKFPVKLTASKYKSSFLVEILFNKPLELPKPRYRQNKNKRHAN